ncbi:ComF family protein [Thermocrinis minervae]|uniref:Predicted amidophosphoribosyltransferases n=1 Tax=Thermocrinis minervae TaxID=381751 RepID=A0A1M6RD03_9AQUI|nr:phosphoribosyltransferase family protein [Thermocrinis minervae]SHK30344.1 Predicted amidophosphoribosyltransferases [Thermocrinis minervae]
MDLLKLPLRLLGIVEEGCINCGGTLDNLSQGYFCSPCLDSIKPFHPYEYKRIPYLFSYRVFGLYQGVLREVIRVIKFENSKTLAYELGRRIAPYLWEYIEEIGPDVITYPPLNIRRFWSRGFNHVKAILQGAQVPALQLFERVGLSKPMALAKGKEERKRYAKEYRLKKEIIDFVEGKRILVVDDLITTGTTVSRLAELLLCVGADEVHGFFVAGE